MKNTPLKRTIVAILYLLALLLLLGLSSLIPRIYELPPDIESVYWQALCFIALVSITPIGLYLLALLIVHLLGKK
ncbi:Uncharacterised protein [Yersinia kristensenii]|nr:Uncharacterised protein [Yersinia kristensenii]